MGIKCATDGQKRFLQTMVAIQSSSDDLLYYNQDVSNF